MEFVDGLVALYSWANLVAIVAGCVIGLVFGLTPGLDATTGTALLLAFTFPLESEPAILLLLAVYMCATYAGSITAICIGVPGTPASAAAVLDGYEMTKHGEPGRALSISIVSSTIGGLFGTVALVLLAAPIARLAVQLGSAEYFALALFALTMVAALVGRNWLKGLLVTAFGVLLTTVGMDQFTGTPRYTFGVPELLDGIPYVPALIGLFAISEALYMAEFPRKSLTVGSRQLESTLPSRRDLRRMGLPVGIGSLGGSVLGALPGVGAAAGNWITYNEAKRFSRRPEEFGHGSPEGLAAAESGNNATVSSALIPLLALGIPGSATAAVLLGGLVIHGVVPGPRLIAENRDLVSVIYAGLFVIVGVMFVLGVTAIRGWVRLLQVPKAFIISVILVMSAIGSYAMRNSTFDLYVMFVFGVFGYALRKAGFSVVPIVLGLVLGGLIQTHFRRAVIGADDGYSVFLTTPVAVVLLALSIASVIVSVWRERRHGVDPQKASQRNHLGDRQA